MTHEYSPFRGLEKGSKLLLAFSGGVDSTIAAHLCRKAGFDVLACTMKLLDNFDTSKAETAAKALDIPLEILELKEEFAESVMRRCCLEFAAGKTPNPCAICNPVFKFGKLMEFAIKNSCAGLVTGHYARILEDSSLARGLHRAKDQSYFLFGLSEKQLNFSYFPLGALTKDEVRDIARSLSLPNADAPESQDACFAPEKGSLAESLMKKFEMKPQCGDFIHSKTGRILGHHNGIHLYTTGQRKGTGVAMGHPAYVKEIQKGNVIITDDEAELYSSEMTVTNVNWQMPEYMKKQTFNALVQVRYRTPETECGVAVSNDGNTLKVSFKQPLRAITRGQDAVIYNKEQVVCGGWIESCN